MFGHKNSGMETEWASCFKTSIKKSGRANVTASLTSGDDSLSLLFSPSPSLPPSLRPFPKSPVVVSQTAAVSVRPRVRIDERP